MSQKNMLTLKCSHRDAHKGNIKQYKQVWILGERHGVHVCFWYLYVYMSERFYNTFFFMKNALVNFPGGYRENPVI